MQTPPASSASLFDSAPAASGSGIGKLSGAEPKIPFNQLLAARQLSLLGAQPEAFAQVQAQALSRFSQEQGQGLSAESVLAELAEEGGQGLPLGNEGLPPGLLLRQIHGQHSTSATLPLDAETQAPLAEGEATAPPQSELALANIVQGQALVTPAASDLQPPQGQTAAPAADAESRRGPPAASEGLMVRAEALKSVVGRTQAEQGASGHGGTFPPPGHAVAAAVPQHAGNPWLGDGGEADMAVELSDVAEADIELLHNPREFRAAAAAAQRPSVNLTLPQNALTDPAWEQAFGARISWLANNGVHNATLHLHPQELGSIQVQLTLDGDGTRVQFETQQADTGELIERMLPRLNQSFEQQGLRLDEVKISLMNSGAQPGAGQQQQGGAAQNASSGQGSGSGGGNQGRPAESNLADSAAAAQRAVVLNRGGVDDYA